MSTTVTVQCYTSKTLANGNHPLMIRICKDGKKRYQSLGISIKSEHWDFKKNRPKPNCPNCELITKMILEKEAEVQKQILEFKSDKKHFTASTLLINDKEHIKAVQEFYEELINGFISSGKRGNASFYKNSLNSLINFTKGRLDIPFSDVDVKWLNKYENWLRERGIKETTLSILFRTLRSVYNKAKENGYVGKVENPFSKFKISKFNVKTKKRAISKEDIKRILDVDLKNTRHYIQLSRDIFIFSYLCGGINFVDIAHLKDSNIVEEKVLHYKRRKTGKEMSIPLNEVALNLIKRYSGIRTSGNYYIFPILDPTKHKTDNQQYHRLHKVLGKINPCLKIVAQLAGVEVNLTTYVARHSFATVLKKSGVSVALISETLGHSDISTTQIYLDSFDHSQVHEAMINLL